MLRSCQLVLLILSFMAPGLASAQTPSQGIPLPDGSVTTQSDAASLEVNPAGLNFLDGGSFSYGFFLPSEDYSLVVPSGHSFMTAFGGSAGGVGVGVQWINNPLLGPERRDFRKYTLGGALGGRHLSFGASWNLYSSRTDERLNALTSTDLGIQWRLNQVFGLGLTARNVSPAFLDEEQSLPLEVGAGFALRFFRGRLVIDSELLATGGANTFTYRPRISAEPLAGIRFFGDAHLDIPKPSRLSGGQLALDGFTIGAEFSMGYFGIAGASYQQAAIGSDGQAMTGAAMRVWAGTPQKRSIVPPFRRWVRLAIDASIAETASAQLFGPSQSGFLELINALDAIAEDASVEGVVLEVSDTTLGYAQIWELHQAMNHIHEAGKESLAILLSPSNRTIFTASAAQEVWMTPNLPYGPTGLLAEFTSFAGLFENIGIEAEFVRIGEYKSAPESFVSTERSEEAREQTGVYLDQIYRSLLSTIASSRNVTEDQIQQVINETPLLPGEALDLGLVDQVLYPDEMEQLLNQRVGALSNGYARTEITDERWGARPEIAIVYIDGTIIDGESGSSPFGSSGMTGAETIRQTLRALKSDRSVRGVVLRVDSPGGSAIGSDLIYRELRNLAQTKPVVASMGNVAASGGYYVAAGADEIFASPNTLTGSIGVFTGKFNINRLASRIGISASSDRRGERAGAFSLWEPWTDSEREGIEKSVEFFYQLFIQQVARTRPLDPSEVDAVGRGRIWTGVDAKDEGLVDHLGGLTDAIRRAEELANIEPGQAIYVDRTGTGGRLLSPGIATGVTSFFHRLGIDPPSRLATPQGELPVALQDFESALLWPLYFRSGDAMALMPYSLRLR